MSERAREDGPVMFKSKDRKPHEIISGRDIKCGNLKDAPNRGKGVVTCHKSVAHTFVLFTPSPAANDISFWVGGSRDFT